MSSFFPSFVAKVCSFDESTCCIRNRLLMLYFCFIEYTFITVLGIFTDIFLFVLNLWIVSGFHC